MSIRRGWPVSGRNEPGRRTACETPGQNQLAAAKVSKLYFVVSTACHACRDFYVGTRIPDEHASVRHLDRGKSPGVERRVGRKQPVQIEDIGRDCIDVVI